MSGNPVINHDFCARSITIKCMENRVRIIAPTARYSDGPLFRRPIIPITHYSDGPFFRQCKIELNPQIHGLTRCIQQDGPSVRLILTDHCLDRMFWKGKGAFIIGSTSPFKAIMIDRPGMGKVKNWRKSSAHCTKEPEKRSEEKKVWTGRSMRKTKWRKIAICMEARRVNNWRRTYIVEKERKGAHCTCRRMEKAPKIGRQFPCSGQ